MRIRCVRTGVVREREGDRGARRYLWAGWRDEALPVNAFLVEHPDGLCLFDTGQTARAATRAHFPFWQPFFRLARFELDEDDEVASQLEVLGVAPESVRWVVLSHLHTDHVGGLPAFRTADVLVSRTEWATGTGVMGRVRGYLPQYWPTGLVPHLLALSDGEFGPFPASLDLAGDGTLMVVATPGHTRGHVSLLVRGEAHVLLGGDVAHSARELELAAPDVARYCKENGIVFLGAHDWDAETLVDMTQARSSQHS